MTDDAQGTSLQGTPSPPTEAATPDQRAFDAILDTFTATARGRWFLAEFARRNRNADIRMVLDAVARIERSRRPETDPPAEPAGTGDVAAKARQQTGAATQAPPAAEQLALAYRSLRAIRAIAWTLRGSGAEAGLCDALDAHANAIDRGLDQFATGGGAQAPSSGDAAAITEAEEAHDLALLDMVAMEMGAPAPDDDAIDAAATPETPDAMPTRDKGEPASLGAAVIASGALRSGGGRLAAISRLSQAEKVALFS
ncbi:MAG: hypothetical protein M9932_10660 [Xanthobacteraceae bacterium]|nr:hypothetical protein [Xanthobacteraceae bacterium]